MATLTDDILEIPDAPGSFAGGQRRELTHHSHSQNGHVRATVRSTHHDG